MITGSGGMGMAVAQSLAPSRSILLLEHDPDRLSAALGELSLRGIEAEGRTCDVTDRASVSAAVERTREMGPLGALVHTAGVFTADTAARVFEINFVGTANVLEAFEPLVEDGTAAVCVASIGGHKPNTLAYDAVVLGNAPEDVWSRLAASTKIAQSTTAAYSMSKRGVILLCQRHALRWGARGGRVVSISPGVIATEMMLVAQGNASQAGNAILDAASPRRAGTPQDIASVVSFLVSPAASYVNGCDLRVDGGSIGNLLTDPALHAGLDAWVTASAF